MMSTKLLLETEVWNNTIADFNPAQRDDCCSQATSIATLFLQELETVWQADGYEPNESQRDCYHQSTGWEQWVNRHDNKAVLAEHWGVLSVLENKGGHLILVLSSQLEHTPTLNLIERYLVFCTIHHNETRPEPQDKFELTMISICGNTCCIVHMLCSRTELLEAENRLEVKLTTASFKEDIQQILTSLAEVTLERVDLKEIVKTASWSEVRSIR
ncbi:hypothetical protein F5B18DRAFT_636389 [Nemania serpens]|nr:hypothetical protein F5B18DRAFT_636389 [Nemania serpens]